MNEHELQIIAHRVAQELRARSPQPPLPPPPPTVVWPAWLGRFEDDPRLATMLLTSFGLFGLYPLFWVLEKLVFGDNGVRAVSDFTYMYGICEFARRYVWEHAFLYLVPVTGWVCGRFDNFPPLQQAYPWFSALSAMLIMFFMTTTMIRFSSTRFVAFGLVFVLKRFMGKPNLLNVLAPGTYISLLASLGMLSYYLWGLHEEVNTTTYAQIITLYFIADWGWASHVRREMDHPLLCGLRYSGVLGVVGFVTILWLNTLHKLVVVPVLKRVNRFLNL
jgi:hypothetical protein